ncbi:peptidyl-prolyl cis-trans isomerase [Pseudohalocynthiibacter aestuariivivens]|uniref:Parvulin-like PPIase n=1 Tax=Pseudohalocynthiibacter aestuariivivens TaxID=1591409 RepID=A0ABV5JBP7_9RHOB|nr:peptidylprolyl isomerase [Pseudohalocynthiibacter aestuariivivens]MBS9718837.1 peptidyl-prolyl cis-trans isomerase [Pseudohalocynthiibacter aestuariivivens]
MMQRVLKEPILHFLAIGVALFGLFYAIDDSPPDRSPLEIVVSEQVTERLMAQFHASWRRAPTPEEVAGLIDVWVDEEIMVREARAFSLDQGDTVIRQRLQQKMQFIAKSAAAAIQPNDEDLRAFFEQNKISYASTSSISFEQIFLGRTPDREATQQVIADLAAGADPATLGQASLMPQIFSNMGQQNTDGTLGPGVYTALSGLGTGHWDGPIQTGYGYHVMRVISISPGEVPQFEDVRDRVEIDWRADVEQSLIAKQIETIRTRYSVRRPALEQIRAVLE